MVGIGVGRPERRRQQAVEDGNDAEEFEHHIVLRDVLRAKQLRDQYLVGCKNDQYRDLNHKELQSDRQQGMDMLLLEGQLGSQLTMLVIKPKAQQQVGQHHRAAISCNEVEQRGVGGLTQDKHHQQR